MTIYKTLLLGSILLPFLLTSNAYAEDERRNLRGEEVNSRVESPFVINTGFSIPSGVPNISFNYNIVDRFSLGVGLGYSSSYISRTTRSGVDSASASDVRIIANGKIYLWNFNQNLSIYTQTDGGIITGSRIVDNGGLFSSTPGQLSTTGRTDFIFAQKLGFEARFVKGLAINVGYGVFYESMQANNSSFLGGLFTNTFVPLALDLLIGYSF